VIEAIVEAAVGLYEARVLLIMSAAGHFISICV